MTVINVDVAFVLSTVLLAILCTFFAITSRGVRIQLKDAEKERDIALVDRQVAVSQLEKANDTIAKKSADVLSLATRLEASLSANGAFEKSRDQVWAMYRRSSIGAGNAQAWLFRELNVALSSLNKYRTKNGEDPLDPPAGLEDALKEFKEEHVDNEKVPAA